MRLEETAQGMRGIPENHIPEFVSGFHTNVNRLPPQGSSQTGLSTNLGEEVQVSCMAPSAFEVVEESL